MVRHCDVAVVKSASSVNQAYRVYLFCDRCALERSLVLLVSGYIGAGAKSMDGPSRRAPMTVPE